MAKIYIWGKMSVTCYFLYHKAVNEMIEIFATFMCENKNAKGY